MLLSHSIKEIKKDCELCNSENSLKKILSSFFTPKTVLEKKKVGSVVKSFIEDAREEVRNEKKKRKDF
jgi:hypothetical protein